MRLQKFIQKQKNQLKHFENVLVDCDKKINSIGFESEDAFYCSDICTRYYKILQTIAFKKEILAQLNKLPKTGVVYTNNTTIYINIAIGTYNGFNYINNRRLGISQININIDSNTYQ